MLILASTIIILLAEKASGGSVDVQTLQNIYNQWYDLASNWAQVTGLSTEEILAIITNESSGNPNATNPADPSYGLMGVSELIGRAYGNISDVSELYTPATNIKAGSTFLAYLKNKYAGSFPLGNGSGWVQMYNEGETAFLKGSRAAKGYEEAFINNYNGMVNITNNGGVQ
jgi:hypothetical protein